MSPLKSDRVESLADDATANALDLSNTSMKEEEEMEFDDQHNNMSSPKGGKLGQELVLNYKRFKSHKEDSINELDV